MKTSILSTIRAVGTMALAGVLLLFFSCTQENLSDELIQGEELNAVSVKNSQQRPWKINSSGAFQAIGPSAENCPDEDKPIGILLSGIGNASHIGLFEVSLVWCTNVDADLASPVNFIAGTITAANGDEIDFESTSFNGPSVDYVVTGGSGRFEGASGEFNLATTAFFFDPSTGAGTYSNAGEGYIVY
ncbi:hypothetical protein ACT6NV_06745 [Robiginitalea sp. IMCC44478]|uniref:hypothetical protein n=1 Tax=Robiginitalea sp. IMCC44478 TaxID=3459122 RepID=UPI004041E18A